MESTDEEMPQKGDVVTFSMKGFTPGGNPIDAQLIRVRRDINWQQVLHEHVQNLSVNGADLT